MLSLRGSLDLLLTWGRISIVGSSHVGTENESKRKSWRRSRSKVPDLRTWSSQIFRFLIIWYLHCVQGQSILSEVFLEGSIWIQQDFKTTTISSTYTNKCVYVCMWLYVFHVFSIFYVFYVCSLHKRLAYVTGSLVHTYIHKYMFVYVYVYVTLRILRIWTAYAYLCTNL